MKTLRTILLYLLALSGVLMILPINSILPASIKNRPVMGTSEDFLLLIIMIVLTLVLVFGPMFLTLYIAYRINRANPTMREQKQNCEKNS